jgi:hypothetical protein
MIGTSRSRVGLFALTRESGLSKYATDDRGQKDRRGGQEQSGNNLFPESSAAFEQPVCEVDGADRIWGYRYFYYGA